MCDVNHVALLRTISTSETVKYDDHNGTGGGSLYNERIIIHVDEVLEYLAIPAESTKEVIGNRMVTKSVSAWRIA